MFCKNCGREQKNGQKFCPQCGTPFPELKEKIVSVNNNDGDMPSSNNQKLQKAKEQSSGVNNMSFELKKMEQEPKNEINDTISSNFNISKLLRNGFIIAVCYVLFVFIYNAITGYDPETESFSSSSSSSTSTTQERTGKCARCKKTFTYYGDYQVWCPECAHLKEMVKWYEEAKRKNQAVPTRRWNE